MRGGYPEGMKEGGMAAFRAEYLEEKLGFSDPHAALFVPESARRYARAAAAKDRRSPGLALARFQRFGERMASAARDVDQFLFLGIGYDTRALWLPEIAANAVRVFEVDMAAVIARKARVLAENGIGYPDRVIPLGIDLTAPDFRRTLENAGFDPSRPSGLFIEGVTFQLPPETSRRILDPRGLGLAAGSLVTFDYWTRDRVRARNARIALAPMHEFALPETPEELRRSLEGLGYRDVSIRPLSELAAALWPDEGHDQQDWHLVEATVA